MAIDIGKQDPRYQTLKRSRNLRWPSEDREYVSQILFCEDSEQAAAALARIIESGKRGGHCYEEFAINNPDGVLLDLSMLTASHVPGDSCRYRISAGKQLGDAYLDLYRRYNLTIPAGTCYTVGAGGHISGGGYGLLSRLHGLTVDWLSSVDILTVDSRGKVDVRRTDSTHDPDLNRACRGYRR